ncbi:MAG: YbaK/EbsC family protein [Spirochaetes bacterium]|nr:MAG: YbaK/EbsC family protein [Spirochaetota bacterium]
MSGNLSSSAKKVQETLKGFGVSLEVAELPDSTRTSSEAAAAIGCRVEQIAKSLVFRAKESNFPVLVIASGINRVDEKKLKALIGEPVGKADAEYVRENTGFAIGGVPPVGHKKKIKTYIDEDLFQYETIWAAAGTPHAVFRLNPNELLKITGGMPVSIKK